MISKKFLEFNGKAIYFLAKNGTYWIAIKPICEALNINYSRQLRTVKADPILSELWSLETIVGADNKLRKMACLSEKFVYGWLFSIRSESKDLLEYKRTCYNLLFDYFHGSITSRETLIREKTKRELEIDSLMDKVRALPEFQKVEDNERVIKQIRSRLRELDSNIQRDQLDLFKSI